MTKVSYKLDIATFYTVSDNVCSVIKSSPVYEKDEYLKNDTDSFSDSVKKFSEAMKKSRISSQLEALDIKRDLYIRNLGDILTGYMAMPFADKVEAAKQKFAVFSKHGGKAIARLPVAKETAILDSLTDELDTLKDLNETLSGVGETEKLLKDAQNEYKAEVLKYNDLISDSKEEVPACSMKKPMLSLLNEQILPYVQAMATTRKGDYDALMRKLDTLIANANTLAPKTAAKKADSGAEQSAQA